MSKTSFHRNKFVFLGCVNTTEVDIKKAYRRGASTHGSGSGTSFSSNPIEQITRNIQLMKLKLERRTIKISKVAEGYKKPSIYLDSTLLYCFIISDIFHILSNTVNMTIFLQRLMRQIHGKQIIQKYGIKIVQSKTSWFICSMLFI